MERKGAAERRLGLGTAHAGEKGKGRRGLRWASGGKGEREGSPGKKREWAGLRGMVWAGFFFYSFSFPFLFSIPH
jgi:hypothetical protein